MNKNKFEEWLNYTIKPNLENLAGLAPTLRHSEKYDLANRISNGLIKSIMNKMEEINLFEIKVQENVLPNKVNLESDKKPEYLVLKTSIIKEFGIGLIQVVKQVYINEHWSFPFVSSNGVTINISGEPQLRIRDDNITLFVRGNYRKYDNKTLIVRDINVLFKILQAVEEYNNFVESHTKMLYKNEVNYVELHQQLWNELRRTGSSDKNEACKKIASENNVSIPYNYCFLCQEVCNRIHGPGNPVSIAHPLSLCCDECLGFWGKPRCYHTGSYYQLWRSATNINERKSLANVISDNTKANSFFYRG